MRSVHEVGRGLVTVWGLIDQTAGMTVTTALSISVDGYIAGTAETTDHPLGEGGEALFAWMSEGDTASEFYPSFRMSSSSARFFDAGARRCGAVVSGRRTYDLVDGWSGSGPLPGVPLFVLTHQPREAPPQAEVPYVLVTDGIESAILQADRAAAGKEVNLMGSTPVRQALSAGLLDEITLHVAPVLLGDGIRLLDQVPASLERLDVVAAASVTHMRYRVVK